MNYHILSKNELDAFIKNLAKKMKVCAPVAKGHDNFAFEEVTSAEGIAVDYLPTILPPKKYFMPPREKLLDFDLTGGKPQDKAVLEAEPLALFGVHTCDLAGIQCLNMVFSEKPRDYNYILRKASTGIVHCKKYSADCKTRIHFFLNSFYSLKNSFLLNQI